MGCGLSYKGGKLSLVMMAPMLDMVKITDAFRLRNVFFSPVGLLKDFIDYTNFNISNFKLYAELDVNNPGLTQMRFEIYYFSSYRWFQHPWFLVESFFLFVYSSLLFRFYFVYRESTTKINVRFFWLYAWTFLFYSKRLRDSFLYNHF